MCIKECQSVRKTMKKLRGKERGKEREGGLYVCVYGREKKGKKERERMCVLNKVREGKEEMERQRE